MPWQGKGQKSALVRKGLDLKLASGNTLQTGANQVDGLDFTPREQADSLPGFQVHACQYPLFQAAV
ncbi:hypothetical protein B0B52_11690 [Polaromonas sp. A23]|nr:hypothetical protein B0B52_11690 [Polaromonas sp. A23]